MTDPNAPEPLPPDIVDELLSALADTSVDNDAFNDAARDHGLTPEVARERLDATPGAAKRARAIDAARAAITSVPPLDDVTRRRLVSTAMKQPQERRRAGRWLLASGGVAAAIAVVVALVTVSVNRTGDKSSLTAGKASSATRPVTTPTTGVVNDERQLRDFVGRVRHAPAVTPEAAPTKPAPSSSPQSTYSAADAGSLQKRTDSDAARAPGNCAASIAASLHLTPPPSLTASVMHDGKPATVLVFTERKGTIAVLFEPANCHILISAFSQ